MNLENISETLTADLQIVHPKTKAQLGIVVTVAGPEHPKRKALEFARARRMREQINLTGKMQLDDPEKAEEDAIDDLVGITLGITGIDGFDFSAGAVRDLYTDPKRAWLRRQVADGRNNLENFIEDSATA